MKPIINLKDTQSNPVTIASAATGHFTDHGAECFDLVDGQINGAIQVSGQVVNLAKPGKYVISYNCKDAADNEAIPFSRTVIVEGSSLSQLKLVDETFVTVEAGFGYTEIGCEGTDTLVNTYSRASADIQSPHGQSEDCEPTVRTNADSMTQCAILEIRKRAFARNSQLADSEWGTCVKDIITTHDNADQEYRVEYMSQTTHNLGQVEQDNNDNRQVFNFYNELTGKGVQYSETVFGSNACGGSNDMVDVSSCADANCHTGRQCRTLLVRDTLPPVITVEHNNQEIVGQHETATTIEQKTGGENNNNIHLGLKMQNGARTMYTREAVVGHANNAYIADTSVHANNGRPIVGGEVVGHSAAILGGAAALAEESSVQSGINGWVVGAIASAISGLALLGYAGYSMKKRNGYSSTVMSVPV